MIKVTAGENDAGRKINRVMRKVLPHYSLSLIHRLLRQKKVKVNGTHAKLDTVIQTNDVIQIYSLVNKKKSVNYINSKVNDTVVSYPLKMPQILWQGSGIIFFNKQSGIATHGKHSMDIIVKTCLAGTISPSLSFKPGPLHRLDKQTSGVIAFSQTLDGARLFSRLLHEKILVKTYLAIVENCINTEEIWEDTLIRDKQMKKTLIGNGKDSKNAITSIKPLVYNDSYTLIEAKIATGRTHQIRAQSAAHGHPLAGDTKYGGQHFPDGNFYLHAWKIELNTFSEIILPNVPKEIVAPLPEEFISKLILLFGQNKKIMFEIANIIKTDEHNINGKH